jgi:antitoxin ChpS
MSEKLVVKQWGNSKAIRLPQAIIAKFAMDNDDYFEATIDNDGILLKPITKADTKKNKRFSKYKLDNLLQEMREVSDEFPIIPEWENMPPVGKEIL